MSPPKVLASLDIGTNSTLFLLAQVDDRNVISPLRHEVRTNDLGRGLDDSGNLSAEVIDLNVRLLGDFKRIAEAAGAEEIRAAATEALRRAGNADYLIGRMKAEHGLEIRILSGREEAEYTYRGIVSGLIPSAGTILAADVGGGSTEIIRGTGHEIEKSASVPVGAVKLDHLFIRQDPPSSTEIDAVRNHVEATLSGVLDEFTGLDDRLIICGGTASSLAAAALGLAEYQPERLAGYVMSQERLERFIERFQGCHLEERRRIPGIGRRRAEIILPGAVLIQTLLKRLGRAEYTTSERGLRYGLLVS
jgi:exopolyphosphatase/guanosine-5'-triphosphate,3'-diphosphate pyrophosphatase